MRWGIQSIRGESLNTDLPQVGLDLPKSMQSLPVKGWFKKHQVTLVSQKRYIEKQSGALENLLESVLSPGCTLESPNHSKNTKNTGLTSDQSSLNLRTVAGQLYFFNLLK